MPKAPGLFSITTGWPRIGRICSPTMRMTISVALRGPNGTTTLIGFEGYLSCAATSTPLTAKTSRNRRPKRFITCSVSALLHPIRRREHALPMQRADGGKAGLGQRRDIVIFRQPRLREHRDRPQLAGLDHRCRARGIDERDLRVADDEIVDHAGGAGLVGNVQHLVCRLL